MDDFLKNLLGMLQDCENYESRKVARTEIGNYTVDTAFTSDYGYETAIWKFDHRMIIVERYDSKKESQIGHEKWCEYCKGNPKQVYSVQLDRVLKF